VARIKFGSRVDVLLPGDAAVEVKKGDRVKGGASVLAILPEAGGTTGEAVAVQEMLV